MRQLNKKQKTKTSQMPGAVTEEGGQLGVIKIHENVIASVVRKATCSVDGIVRLAGSALVDNIAEIVGSRKIYDRAISINIEGTSAEIEVNVVVAYGAYVPSVAAEVQSAVIEKVEKITGMSVSRVDVVVQDLIDAGDFEEEEKKEE